MSDWPESSYDLFISHARSDGAWVRGYLLPALGLPADRVLMPNAFQPGAPLVAEIERGVTASRFTLLVLSPAYLADVWSELGADFASHLAITQHQARLIPIQLQPCELPLRLSFRVALDCTEQANWDQEIARLRDLLGQPTPALAPVRCPYPGMAPFQAGDARFFYGREPEIDDMLQRLRHQRFLVVIGDSGSGKSSLINAGLLPRLAESSFFPSGYWCVAALRPGSQPLQALAQALGADPNLDFNRSLDSLLAAHPPARRLLLVVDQFEELFTQAGRQEQIAFVAALQTLHATETCSLVLAIRGDFFYTDLMETALWPVPPAERLEIAPLRGEALAAAIERPAAAQEVYLEPRLVERLLADAAEERGALPLVQEALVQLWARMDGRLLTLAAYERLGSGHSGLAAALETKANATLVELARRSPHHEVIARRIFLRLVQFGEGRSDTRRQQPEDALRSNDDGPAAFDETLKHLAENRLLTLSGEAGQDTRVDIAHEALFTGWPALRDLVREQRQPEQARRRLEDWAANWLARGCDPKALLNAIELGQAEEWLASPAAAELGHSAALRALAEASRAALTAAEQAQQAARQRELAQAQALAAEQKQRAEAEQARAREAEARTEAERARVREQERSARRLRGWAVGLALVAALAVIASFLALRQANLASARQLGAQSYTLFKGGNYRVGALLALHASQLSPAAGAEVLAKAPFVLKETPATVLGRHTSAINSLAWQLDGKALASTGMDGRVVVWEQRDAAWQAVAEPGQPGGLVSSAAWQPGANRLAWTAWNSAERSHGIQLWEPDSGAVAFKPIDQAVSKALAWDVQGTRLAVGASDGRVEIWDAATLETLDAWLIARRSMINEVLALAWDPAGRQLAAVLYSGRVLIWDVQTETEIEVGDLTAPSYVSLAWNPRDAKLAVIREGSVAIWNGATLEELPGLKEYLAGPTGAGYYRTLVRLAWRPDGSALAITTSDGEVIIWDVKSESTANTLRTHTPGPVLAWHPDGGLLAIGMDDGYILLWEPDRGARAPAALISDATAASAGYSPGQPIPAVHATWDAAGQALAFIESASGAIKVWLKADDGLVTLPASRAAGRSIAWRPARSELAVGDGDGNVVLWDLTAATPVSSTLLWAGEPVRALTWAPDGRTLAIVYAGDANRIDLWNADANARLPTNLARDAALGPVVDLAFRPVGDTLAAITQGGDIYLWDPKTGEQITAPFGRYSFSYDNRLAWSPDGNRLASGHTESQVGRVIIWDATGRAVHTLTSETSNLLDLAWSPDNRFLAVSNLVNVPLLYEEAHSAGRVQVWDTTTGRLAATLQPPDTWRPLGVAWEPSGDALTLWSSWGGGLTRVPAMYTREICGWLNRNLGYQDWREATRERLGTFLGISPIIGGTYQAWLDVAVTRLYRPACPKLPQPAVPNPLRDRDENTLLEWVTTLEGGLMLFGLAILLLAALALAVRQVVRWIRRRGQHE